MWGGWRKGFGNDLFKTKDILPTTELLLMALVPAKPATPYADKMPGQELCVICDCGGPPTSNSFLTLILLKIASTEKKTWVFISLEVSNQTFSSVFLISQIYREANSSRLITLCIYILCQ